jgi:ATP-binding cassette subfamily C (CFTR/MRP) protein 1
MADFCLDPEGWGPVSKLRYSFTPCFEEGILAAIPPLFLLFAGSAQAWQFSQSSRIPNSRNWVYWVKIAVVFGLLGLNVCLAVVRWRESGWWQRDVLYWSALLKVIATGFAVSLHHLEHVRATSPVPSGVLLFYLLGTILIDIIKVYSMIDEEDVQRRLVYFVIFSVVLGGEVLIFCLEYLVPKGIKDYRLVLGEEEDDGAEICPADYADIFSRYLLCGSWLI